MYDNILTILVVTSSCTSMLTISLKDVLHFSSLADFKRSSVFKLCHIYRSLSKKPQTSMSFGTHFPRVWSSTALVFHCVLFLVWNLPVLLAEHLQFMFEFLQRVLFRIIFKQRMATISIFSSLDFRLVYPAVIVVIFYKRKDLCYRHS